MVVILLLIPVAYWPGGEFLQESIGPRAYFLWVVIGLPAIITVIFGINAYLNVEEDKQLEGQGGADHQTSTTDAGGEI